MVGHLECSSVGNKTPRQGINHNDDVNDEVEDVGGEEEEKEKKKKKDREEKRGGGG